MSKQHQNENQENKATLLNIYGLINIARECKKTYDEIGKVLREFGLISYTSSYASIDRFIQLVIETQQKTKTKQVSLNDEIKKELELCSNAIQQLQYIYSVMKGEGIEDLIKMFSRKEEEEKEAYELEDETRLYQAIEKFKKKKRKINEV